MLPCKSFQMRSTDSIDSGFHSLSIGGHRRLSSGHHQPPARVMFKTSGDLGPSYCEMVRYQHGGQRQRSEARHRRPSHTNMVRSRSKSRDRGYRGGHRQAQLKDTELLWVLVFPCCKVNTWVDRYVACFYWNMHAQYFALIYLNLKTSNLFQIQFLTLSNSPQKSLSPGWHPYQKLSSAGRASEDEGSKGEKDRDTEQGGLPFEG